MSTADEKHEERQLAPVAPSAPSPTPTEHVIEGPTTAVIKTEASTIPGKSPSTIPDVAQQSAAHAAGRVTPPPTTMKAPEAASPPHRASSPTPRDDQEDDESRALSPLKLEASAEFLRAAMHAVALEDSLESTDALLSAARDIYSSPPRRGPVTIPTQPTVKEASPKAPTPRPPSPRLELAPQPLRHEEEKKDEEEKDRGEPVKPRSRAPSFAQKVEDDDAQEKPAPRPALRLSKACESSDDESRHSAQDEAPACRPKKTARRKRPSSRSSSSASLVPTTEVGRRLLRLASQGSITLSATQLRMLEASLPKELGSRPSTARSRGSTTPRIKELAQPTSGRKSQGNLSKATGGKGRKLAVFARLEDAKECTFKPRIHRWSGGEQKDEDGDEDGNAPKKEKLGMAFMDRQFSTEAARRKALERARREAEYGLRVDKKRCPGCGVTQSFDEVAEKKKTCPRCELAYCHKTNWQAVAHGFHRRQTDFAKVKVENNQRLIEEELAEIGTYEKRVVDPETGKLVLKRVEPIVWNMAVAEEFFDRAAEWEEKRMARLMAAEEKEGYRKTGGGGKGRRRGSAAAWGGSDDEEGEEGYK